MKDPHVRRRIAAVVAGGALVAMAASPVWAHFGGPNAPMSTGVHANATNVPEDADEGLWQQALDPVASDETDQADQGDQAATPEPIETPEPTETAEPKDTQKPESHPAAHVVAHNEQADNEQADGSDQDEQDSADQGDQGEQDQADQSDSGSGDHHGGSDSSSDSGGD